MTQNDVATLQVRAFRFWRSGYARSTPAPRPGIFRRPNGIAPKQALAATGASARGATGM